MATHVRRAVAADALGLHEVFLAVLRDGRGTVMGADEAGDGASIGSRLDGPGVTLVAEEDGVVVGEAALSPFGPSWLAHGAMLSLQVHPAWQGRGIGRALLGGLLDQARARGLERVELYVRADNTRAIALYRSEGFVLEGVRRAFVRPPGGPAVDDLVMARFLHPPRAEKVVALVVRGEPRELLVFTHPTAGVQLPRGTIEPGEQPEDVALRELHEESGLVDVRKIGVLPPWDQPTAEVEGDGRPVLHRTHAFVLESVAPLPDSWAWAARGSEDEAGLEFRYTWQALEHASIHPAFHEVLHRLRAWIRLGR